MGCPKYKLLLFPEEDSITIIPVFAAQVKDAKVHISEEHSEFKWVNSEEAKIHLAWEGQRKSVDIIKEYVTNQTSPSSNSSNYPSNLLTCPYLSGLK